ncbi:MAG: aminotransferase class I/II-fold pyridoxal phosphate-dependent enzyme [Candidatus Delongbacteria bacterium]|nr:aminotransferase class I/II-fold pyridoxal phosphate-dependent enzyme [Candidatus Delongbacteria bacterium]MBN2834502.1 aminotransferase class I/II-fold pyridoxal phosphate-dependent enzyme [Candidatus Delongbacteria bacterium]
MNIRHFKLERYFAKYEFSAKYLLSSSDCDPLSQKEVLSMASNELLSKWERVTLGYSESRGDSFLLKEISKLYKNIADENVVIGAPQELILLAIISILKRNDDIIVTYPAYQSLYSLAEDIGCKVRYWTYANNQFDINDLKIMIEKRVPRLLIINFPHNPTGFTPKISQIHEIIELCRKNDILILSDEMYRFLETDEIYKLPAISDIYENGISLCGLSKSFSLPGLRTGWLVSRRVDVIEKILEMKDFTTICQPSNNAILSIIALQNRENIIRRNKSIILENVNYVEQVVKNYSVLNWLKPLSGPITLLSIDYYKGIDHFTKELVDRKSVMLLPITVYDFVGNSVRLGLGRKNFIEGFKLFEEFLNEVF